MGLHLVKGGRGSSLRRPSIIVDVARGKMTAPWTVREMEAMCEPAAPIPLAVMRGMWIAAWARAEHCPLNITRGCLEPHCRYEPSDALCAALGSSMADVVGSLFFAVPVLLHHETRRAWAASWRYCAHGAPMGRS